MIIPIRCMNCGNSLGDLYRGYQRLVNNYRKRDGGASSVLYLDTKTLPITAEKQAMDDLGLKRYCCRKHMLTHVDLIEKV